MHPRPAPRRGRGQHKPPYQVRPVESDFLGYEAADRKPEEVDLRGVQGGDERDGVPRHLRDRVGVVPVVPPTPTLSNATTRRRDASASTSWKSQFSKLPRKCCNSTNGTATAPISR